MIHNPIVGVGVGAFPRAEGGSELAQSLAAQGKGFKWSVAHNSFLETGAELGIPGALVFIAMLVVTGVSLTRISPRGKWAPWITRREMALAQMLIGAIVGFAVAGFFVSAEYFAYLYFILGLSVGLTKLVRLRAGAFPAARPQINVRLASPHASAARRRSRLGPQLGGIVAARRSSKALTFASFAHVMDFRRHIKSTIEQGALWSGIPGAMRRQRRGRVLILAYHNIVPGNAQARRRSLAPSAAAEVRRAARFAHAHARHHPAGYRRLRGIPDSGQPSCSPSMMRTRVR